MVLLGPSGVGKAHTALALAQRAVNAGYRVRFVAAADLMVQLGAAKAQGRLKEDFNRAVLGPKPLVVPPVSGRLTARDTGNTVPACGKRRLNFLFATVDVTD